MDGIWAIFALGHFGERAIHPTYMRFLRAGSNHYAAPVGNCDAPEEVDKEHLHGEDMKCSPAPFDYDVNGNKSRQRPARSRTSFRARGEPAAAVEQRPVDTQTGAMMIGDAQ